MKPRSIIVALTFLLLTVVIPTRAGEVLDRIVATVNKQIILQSDWDDAVCYEAFMNTRPVDKFTSEERKAVLDRLIDQELLKEQMRSDSAHASEQEVAKRVLAIRKQYPEAKSDQAWHDLLVRYGFSESDLKRRIALQLDLMRLVDEHLRPTVQIDAKSIESYYNQQLLPELHKSGAKEIPLADVTPKIKELLTQQQVNQLLAAWLQNLRSGSDIRTDLSQLGSMDRTQ